jgi:hypothetical protein
MSIVRRCNRLECVDPISARLTETYENPRREGDLEFPCALQGGQAALWVLVRGSSVSREIRV